MKNGKYLFGPAAIVLAVMVVFVGCSTEVGNGDNTPAIDLSINGKSGSGSDDVVIKIAKTEANARSVTSYTWAIGDFYTVTYNGEVVDQGTITAVDDSSGNFTSNTPGMSVGFTIMNIGKTYGVSPITITITTPAGSAGTTFDVITGSDDENERIFRDMWVQFGSPYMSSWPLNGDWKMGMGFLFYNESYADADLADANAYWASLPQDGTVYRVPRESPNTRSWTTSNLNFELQLSWKDDGTTSISFEIRYPVSGTATSEYWRDIPAVKVSEIVDALLACVN
jgi:hypothetical protein